MYDKENVRCITQRVVIKGNLELLTPANFGNGDSEGLTDMPLALDMVSDKPLLTGTSIAGALRAYLNECLEGYGTKGRSNTLTQMLFGADKENEDGEQSCLIVDDAIAKELSIEIRDGVKIDYQTRTAEDRKKYDLELIAADTVFPLRFELLLPDDERKSTQLKEALALALAGFEKSRIGLGARKTRGFGRCQVKTWEATIYNLQTPDGFLAWLSSNYPDWGYQPTESLSGKATEVLKVSPSDSDKRQVFTIEATFALKSSLLVRSDQPLTEGDAQPDTTHIRSRRKGEKQPIIPGTSLAGVLRSRADRILNTLNSNKTKEFLNNLFGTEMMQGQKPKQSSRLIIHESVIEQGHMLVQNRVGIDRFTGGALDTALFNEAPQFGGEVTLSFHIREPKDEEIGLLLLLLKDLWTSDLPIGGTSSVGRGRLCGQKASIRYINGSTQEWIIEELQPNMLTVKQGNKDKLESFVRKLCEKLEVK